MVFMCATAPWLVSSPWGVCLSVQNYKYLTRREEFEASPGLFFLLPTNFYWRKGKQSQLLFLTNEKTYVN